MRSSVCTSTAVLSVAFSLLYSLCSLAFAETLPPPPPKAGGSGVVYYVSAATGNDSNKVNSLATPFKTIGKAAWISNPGDTIYVMNGNYPEQVYIDRPGSAAGGYITYQAYPGQKPVLTGYNAYAPFNFASNAAYIIIDGFTVIGPAKNLTAAQAQSMTHNFTSYTNNGNCIAAKGNHIVIRNNNVSWCPGSGIGAIGDYLYIYNNIVHHNSFWSPAAKSGISVTGKDSDTSTAAKIWVYNNTIYDNQNFICNAVETSPCLITDGEGIISDSNKLNNFQGRTLIFNNVAYNNGGPGISIFYSQHVDVFNNTTWYNNVSATAPAPYTAHTQNSEVSVGKSSDVRVLNNIMYSRPGAPILYYFGMTLDQLDWDYNIGYNSVGTLAGVGSHNLIVNPQFVNAGAHNFKLLSDSPAIDAGTNTIELGTDMYGKSRAPGMDVGAIEN